MRTGRVHSSPLFRVALSVVLAAAPFSVPAPAQDKPTGAPLELSPIETEQEIPLAILLPDGKTAKCVTIRLHWHSQPDVGPNEDATSFTLDLPADNPAAPIFTAQLWHASLASALAWQQPWEGARWKVLQTPVTDGTGLDAALALGMIATSARRPYPAKTVVIGHLNPDGSLGPVSRLVDRMEAAAAAGMTRVIIPSVQRFDTDGSGQPVNMVRHAADLHLECVPVDDLVAATQTVMNDPLPDTALDSSVPKYSNDVASYIDDFAHHEQNEAVSGLKFAPKESDLATYPPRLAAIWKSVYADVNAAQDAYRAGQVYVAYRLFCRANGRMNGANALAGETRTGFDVKTALAESQDLHDHVHILMNPPPIDQGGLESSVLVAEMADWAYDINAALEGAQLVTKQAYSQRSDATEAEKDRAREAILFANEQCKYLVTEADFYTGLLAHISKENPVTVDENAAHLLPQLIPAQLATARSFTDGIRASDLRDGLLFDSRLVAYVNVLRQSKADWDALQRRKENDTDTPANGSTPAAPDAAPVKLNANAPASAVGFDPGDTYRPPHTVIVSAVAVKKLSDVAQCLIWVNNDCEIAALDEKYLRLGGTMDAATHEWRVKDRGRLDALLQMAEVGARHGIAFADKAQIDPSVLAMIYERAAHERIEGDDSSALDALRNYWRCALLGNMCWELAHTPKAQPVDLSTVSAGSDGNKTDKKDGTKTAAAAVAQGDKTTKAAGPEAAPSPTTPANAATASNPPIAVPTPTAIATPVAPAAEPNAVIAVNPPVAPSASQDVVAPQSAPPAENSAPTENPPVAPVANHEVHAAVTPATMTRTDVAEDPPVAPIASHDAVNPVAPTAIPRADVAEDPPVAPIATNDVATPAPPTPAPPAASAATNSISSPATPAPSPSVTAANDPDGMNIPVVPVARVEDYSGGDSQSATNAAPPGPIPPSTKPDNADGHGGSFP